MTNIESGQPVLVHRNTISDVTTEISYYKQYGCCTDDAAIKIAIFVYK